jgi:hydroxymethylglutaryl-CoA reductase
VVAALSKTAKFWAKRGGFKAEILGTEKLGQVHFFFYQDPQIIKSFFTEHKSHIIETLKPHLRNMEARSGGLRSLELLDMNHKEENYFQIKATFETCDAMGANLINTVLEAIGTYLRGHFSEDALEVVLCILSNYTPNCVVKTWVECPISELGMEDQGLDSETYAKRFAKAVRIAEIEPHRATTHNKGIMNGVDAVVLATGNDFRAVEACAHTYAAKDGQYASLSHCSLVDDVFRFELTLPIALGTVGGLTKLHPLAAFSLELLNHPSAEDLMSICAAVGLAQNFAALNSLVTTGIQKGHMKMHLLNILNQLNATEIEKELAKIEFTNEIVSHHLVSQFLADLKTENSI